MKRQESFRMGLIASSLVTAKYEVLRWHVVVIKRAPEIDAGVTRY